MTKLLAPASLLMQQNGTAESKVAKAEVRGAAAR
jgi:hypothetical protein